MMMILQEDLVYSLGIQEMFHNLVSDNGFNKMIMELLLG